MKEKYEKKRVFNGEVAIQFPALREIDMKNCESCGSRDTRVFDAELATHFPGLKGLNKPIVWVFPKLLVCLECGKAEFQVSERELRILEEGDSAGAA